MPGHDIDSRRKARRQLPYTVAYGRSEHGENGENIRRQPQPGGAAAKGFPVPHARGFHPQGGRGGGPFAAAGGLVGLSRPRARPALLRCGVGR